MPCAERPIFYFDLASPLAYFAAERMNGVLRGAAWCPVFLGAQGAGDSTPGGREALRQAARGLGLMPLRLPRSWPGDTLSAMCAATYASSIGRGQAFALAAFRQAFAGGRDLGDPETLLLAGAACEIHPRALLRAIEAEGTRRSLLATTRGAEEAGVRSVPAVSVGDRTFLGNDAPERARHAFDAFEVSGETRPDGPAR